MSSNGLDPAKSEAFTGKMMDVLNDAGIALMTSIGHQTGLFDTMANLPTSTSEQIATAAGLNERYVREWLGAMVTGRIVEYRPADQTYWLPPEHGQWLTQSADLMMRVLMLAEVEQEIIRCFQNGGGVPYAAYTCFHQILATENYDPSWLDEVLSLVPGLADRLQAGVEVADIGCGYGYAVNRMAQAFPNSRFTGYDFLPDGITAARATAGERGLSNAHFELKDAATLDLTEQYDLITAIDAIHDQARPARVLQGINRALKPGGTFLMVDIAASSKLEENMNHQIGPFLYTVSCMHCMSVSLAYEGAGLGTAWGEQLALQMLAEAGFTQVEVKQIDSDPFNNYYIAARG